MLRFFGGCFRILEFGDGGLGFDEVVFRLRLSDLWDDYEFRV